MLRSPKPWCLNLVFSASFWWIGVPWLGLRLFGVTAWKLLIIESFSHWKLNKIKTENCIGISGCSRSCWKALGESDWMKLFHNFHSYGVEDIDSWVGFVAGNSIKLQKLGLERNISWPFNVFCTWANITGYTSWVWNAKGYNAGK